MARPRLRLVAHRRVTADVQRQRELAWLLYITEGYIANLRHAKADLTGALFESDLAAIRQAEAGAQFSASRLRQRLSTPYGRAK